MVDLDDRASAMEKKYANDQDKLFKIEARASKLLGLWAAQEMGLSGDEASDYAGNVVSHNLKEPGMNDVIAKVSADLGTSGKESAQVSAMLAQFLRDAEEQINQA